MLQGADLAVLDAGGLERLRSDPMVHMTALECAQTARAAGVRRTLLSHLVPYQPMEETLREAKDGYENVELAMPLATYPV
jgi:ribonuclease BN (tRNA processing enzyme)